MSDKIEKTEEEWKAILPPERFHILREKGTEPPFTGLHCETKGPGIYRCGGCGQELFSSNTKFESGSGWPSFTHPVHEVNVKEHSDHSHGMVRVEVTCSRCGGHLGHVFSDGPRPTGLRYCINSAAIDFSPRPESYGQG